MNKEVGRNDPCPCGSGKKYKACCWSKQIPGRKKFSAKVLTGTASLMERTITSQAAPQKSLKDRITKSAES